MAERVFTVPLPVGMPGHALQDAMQGAGEAILFEWRRLVAAEGAVDTGGYLAQLTPQKALQYPYGDDYTVAVINTAAHAWFLEYGRAGFHMPSRWTHWLTNQKGGLYARVPFRIRTPGSNAGGLSSSRARLGGTMPAAVYEQARLLERGRGRLRFGVNEYRASKSYVYYRQIFDDFPEALADVQGYTWKTGQYEGLFFAGEHHTPGGGNQGQYYTIRTIKPDSPGWFNPPTPGHHFAERALNAAAPAIEQMLSNAAAADTKMALLNAVRDLA